MNGRDSGKKGETDTKKTMTNELLKWKETAQDKERESQLRERLLDVPLDTVEPANEWKRKCERLEGTVANLRKAFDNEHRERKCETTVLLAANPVNVAIGAFPCIQRPHHVAFTSAQLLQRHMNRHHSSRHRFPCDQCDDRRTFTKIGDLNVHKKRVHSGLKPFTCTFCQKSFAKKGDLKRHERVHTGERPFVCSVCQKAFVSSSHLRRHERLHSGEKQYCCQHCGRKFNQSGDCWSHQKSCSQRRIE